jgi:hypothetical protein
MQTLATVLFGASVLAFIACWLSAVTIWAQAVAIGKQSGSQSSPVPWSSPKHPAHHLLGAFMLALLCGAVAFFLAAAVGVGFGVLH